MPADEPPANSDEARAVLDAMEHWRHLRNDMRWDADGFPDALAESDAALDDAIAAYEAVRGRA